jgi:hypothetical protein
LAATRITITLEEGQAEAIRELVAARRAAGASAFV